MTTLIFLHGALGTSNQFISLKKQLDRDYHIYTPDFPGHGLKAGEAAEFSIDSFVDFISNFYQENNIQKAGIFGYSMGGYVALKFAGLFPEKVQAIFTFATKLDWNTTFAEKEVKMLDPVRMKEKVPAFVTQLENIHGIANWMNVVNNTASMIHKLGVDHLTTADFQKIQMPVKLARGDKDGMVSAAEISAVCLAIPNATMLTIPEAAHPFESANTFYFLNIFKTFFNYGS